MSILHMLADWGVIAVMFLLSMLLAFVRTDCDPSHPDTAANREAFHTFMGFAPGKNVTEVYFCADEGFMDEAYWLSFRAPQEIIGKIIQKYDLKKIPPPNASGGTPEYNGLNTDYHWWDQSERSKGSFYQNTLKDGSGHPRENRALWYDFRTGKAQFSINTY